MTTNFKTNVCVVQSIRLASFEITIWEKKESEGDLSKFCKSDVSTI